MRIILFIIFYIATYVARIAICGDIAKTVPESSIRFIFKQKSGATERSRVSEISIDDGIIQMINKYNRQSLLGNRIDGFPLSRKLNSNLERVKRSLRNTKKYAKNSNSKIAHLQSDVNDDDIDEEGISSNMARFPIWRVPESIAAINLDSTTNPTIMETEMSTPSLLAFERSPSQLEDLDYDGSLNQAIFPIAEQYLNSRGLSDINVSNQNLILSKIANSKPEIKKIGVQNPVYKGLNNKMLFSAYQSGISAGVNSLNFSRPQEFQQRYNGHEKDPSNPYNVKEEFFNDHLTGSNKKFLLVPVSKDLYVLKDVRESPRTNVDGIITPKRYKLLERNKDNVTSAIISFKAHMHHDAKDVGRTYLQRGNHCLFDHNANYLYPILDPRIPEENRNPTENPVSPSYPDFLYPGIVFHTRPNLIDASPIPDYENISLNINSRGGINSYNLSAFLLSSSLDIPNYDLSSKENANDDQSSVSSAIKLNDEINLFQQNSENYRNSLGYIELGVELTTTDFRDIFGTLDDNIYTSATLENVEMYLTNDDKIFDLSRNRENDFKFSTERNEDKSITDFINDISTQYSAAFDASTNKVNTFFPNIIYTSINNAKDVLNSEDIDKDDQEYGISIPGKYNNKKSISFNDFDYNNRSIDEVLLNDYTTEMDSFLNTEDYVTFAPLLSGTDKWHKLKKVQSNIENSRVLLMAIKPLSSELEKLLSAVKLVNQSISNVQSRLCDKKNVIGSAKNEQENKDKRAMNIAKLANKVDHYGSDVSVGSFNRQSLDKRRIKIKDESVAERDVKIRRKINSLFLNKLTTPFRKRESSINSEVQSSHRNFLKKRKLNEREFLKSGDVERRRLPHSRFNRKSLTKSYKMRVKPIRRFIEIELKKMKRTTSIIRLSRFVKNNVPNESNFADEHVQNHQESDRSMILLNNMPSMFLNLSTKDNSTHFLLNDKRDLTQRNIKRAMSSQTSGSDKEKKFPPIDPQFYREATAYLDILRLLGKTEKPHIKYATDVAWNTQNLTESFPSMIFTTKEFSVSTFFPYFTEKPIMITASNTIAEKEEASEMTESSLHEYVSVTDYYDERNYTKIYKGYEYEEITSEISEIISLTQSPVTLSAFTITIPTTLPLFYTTELTILSIDEAAILTTEITIEKIVITSAIITEVTETLVTIPTKENFTTKSAMLLTPFLEGMMDITLKITIPVATKTSIGETSALIAEVTTEKEIMEGTSTTEITQSSFVETNISLYTFSTVSLFRTTETELTIKTTSSTIPISTTLTITKGHISITSESTFVTERIIIIPTVSLIIITTLGENVTLYKAESTTAIASSPTVLKRTETILGTSTEVEITTLISEDESPVTQIEKTITAEETATEAPTTVETLGPTETTTITTKTSTIVTEISTSIETTITKILIINKTLTTAKTFMKTSTTSEIPTISTIPATIEAATITKTSTPTEILTTLETAITKETASAKTLTPIGTKATTEISTSIETTTITKIQAITETLTTETSLFTETSTISEIPTTISIIPTTIETTATMEISTLTKILTTKIPTTKKIAYTKALTSSIIETLSTTGTQIITETPTTTKTLGTTEIPLISTMYITTKFFMTSENITSSMVTMSPKEFLSISILTTFTTVFITAESTITYSIAPITTTSVKTTTPTLKLPRTTPLALTINTTLSETLYTTISSTFFTMTEGPITITSFKTVVSTTSLKVTTTTPLSLIRSTIPTETPNTTFSTFLIEEITASTIPTMTTSSLETFQTTAVLPIPTTPLSTIKTYLTISSITTYMTENVTVPSATASTITTEIVESTISPVIYFTITTPSITKIPITTSIVVKTETIAYETISILVTSSFLIETIESTTSPILKHEKIKEYEEYYYESTTEEIVKVTSAAKLTTKERMTTWITVEETTIVGETILMYLPLFTTSFFIEMTTEVIPLVIETITLPAITEETSLIEKIVTVTPITVIEETSTLSEITLISTEISTASAIETSITSTTLVPTIIVSLLEETATKITETSLITTIATLLPTTERPEYVTILEAAITVMLAPFSESILSILITSETPATTVEVISILPKTVPEEFMVSTTPSITYATKSSTTLFIETMVHPTVSILAATTEKILEVETEYYVAKEPIYEEEYEEYEEYDTEIPTGKWYYYDEYETTTKKRTTVTVKYTKLPKEKATSPPFIKGTTTSYEIETSEFTRYSIPSGITSTYTSEISYTYTEEEVASTSAMETFVSVTVENVTTIEVETEFTASTASEEVESTTTWLTFGSTEEYTLPSSTVFEIPTEPLEYLTIPPKYMDLERFTQIWPKITLPKFITKPKEISEIILKKTTITSERILTETEIALEKLTSFFISSALTTLSEKEAIEVQTTAISTAFSEIESTIKIGYEITTLAMTEEETVPHVTPFITSETEIELVFTTTNKTIEREEQKEQLLQQLDDLKQHEKEIAEREERLKEKEKQWDIEKEKRKKMMQREKEEAKNVTVVIGTEGYVTTAISVLIITSPIVTIGTKKFTVSTITETEVTSPGLDTSITTLSLAEITTPTETTPFSVTKEITSVTYTTEKMEEVTTEKSTSTIYATKETEEMLIPYATEKNIFITYLTEEIEKMQITAYIILTPYVTTSMDLYVGLASIETTIPFTKEIYTTSYVSETTPFSITEESTSVTYITEKTEKATTEGRISTIYATEEIEKTVIPYTTEKSTFTILPITTFSERFEEISVTSATTPTWYTTEETYTAIYSKPLFTLPAEFTSTISSTLTISTTIEIKYNEEIESLREELRKKERELEEREKILLKREERLERDIREFEKYMEEFKKKKTSIIPSEKSTVFTSLSTPVPPTERTTIKTELTTAFKRVTEKKENRTTTKMVTSQYTEIKDIEEKKRTMHVLEKTVTQKEEEIVTKRICLNVLENTTIPLDKRRRDIVTKKICLPYFPEKNRQKRSVGRLSRRLLALQSTKKIRKPRLNISSDCRYRRRVTETIRKIDNLQLSYHEWLINETTKPLQHFKGFTRIYRKMRKFPKKISTIDTRRNTITELQDKTPLYEQRVLDRHESVFQPTATSMLDNKKYRKRNAFFRYDLISIRKSNISIDDKANVRKRDVSPIENNARFWSRKSTANISSQRTTTATEAEEDGFYTVNVLHLSYNEDNQTHEVISTKPNEDELTAILSKSNDNIYITQFGEGRKITTQYKIEKKDGLEEEDDELSDETEKKMEEEDDYVEDMIENYMNYEEHETSTRIYDRRFLNERYKDKRTTKNERELLDQSWPVEKSTTYHLGGTRFWKLDFVTEPSVILRTTIDKSKTINVSITRTTCFDIVLKNERSTEIKPNEPYRKRNVYNEMRKHISIEKRNAGLKNVTRKNALYYKLRTKRPRMIAKKLKRDSRKLYEPNYYKRSFEEKRTVKFNDFRRANNENSITAKSRKLCGVNAYKSKRQVAKHNNATEKHKKKQLAKSRGLQNINLYSSHNTDNCVVNKKNKYHKTMTTASRYSQVKTTDKKNNEKVMHPNIIGHKNESTSALHEKKIHNCSNCICDIANVVNNIKSLLDRISFPLDEIKALNCNEYKEIQNKIVISMDSDVQEAREFPQPHYNTEFLKDQKYIKLKELEDNFKSDLELDSDHDVISLPGLNLNLPCNQDGDGITWLSRVSRPSYTWKRTDGIALFGFVAENGDLELRNLNAKDTGNYTCVMTYMGPDNEEPVETAYEVHLQVVTLPKYIVHGESRYHVRSCDEGDLDVLVTYLPLKLNSVICETDICNAYVLTPACSRSQITVNILLVPSHIVKLMTVDPKHCNVFCLKAIQDKLSLILSKNLQIFLGRTIIFRLPHYEQRLVPIDEKSSFARRKRGRTDANASPERFSNIGLFSSCPAGYGLRDTRCVPCNVGTYSEDGVSHCKKCPSGTYQPNHGARVCRTCTNPLTKGCSNMLWNSFSAIMVTLASIGAMLSMCLLLLWIICCAKKKFCMKQIASIVAKEDAFEREKHVEEQPLIKDASENEDQQWDSENRVKRKKEKFYVNKKRRKQNERRKYKTHIHEDEWGSHRVKNAPIICPDSYQSHEDYNNYYPKQSYRKGPRLPECDFDT